MGVKAKTKILLAFRSGDTCALPECEMKGRRLSQDSCAGDPANVGDAAHIVGEHGGKDKKPSSARFDPEMNEENRNSYHNLIYLCKVCHKRIDALPEGEIEYPAERLLSIKREHEEKVRRAMLDAFATVGFPELEEATRWVASIQPSMVTTDYSLPALSDKIKKNDLGEDAHVVIATGLSIAGEVSRYIESVAQIDPGFPERLKAGFLSEYWRIKGEGVSGGELFELMCQFAQQGFERQAQRSAGLAVLIHMFESCEVFEK